MAFVRILGSKLHILHNVREGRHVRQQRLHVFDSAADARDALASEREWTLLCDSLDLVLGGKSRVDRPRLRAQLAAMVETMSQQVQRDPLAEAAARLTGMLEGLSSPLPLLQRKSLERARDSLTRLRAALDGTLALLAEVERKKEENMQPLTPTGLMDSPAEQYLDEGLAFYERGEWSEAKRVFLAGLRLQPDHVDLLVHAGLCEMMCRNTELALACFERAATFGQQEADRMIASNPTEYIKECDWPPPPSPAHSDEDDDAEQDEDDSLSPLYSHHEFRPFFRALTNKAVALIDLKQHQEAIETLLLCQSYQSLDGTSNMIGICYLNLGDVEAAAHWYREMFWAEARYLNALIQFRLGKTEDALRNLLIGIPWNPHIGRMLVGIEKPDKVRYHGALQPWHEASEFMHKDGHLFRSESGFRALAHCVLDDPAIDELLTEVADAEQRRREDRTYRFPDHLWDLVNGRPDASFLSHHTARLLARFQESGGPYWLPNKGDCLAVTVLERKSQNWRVHLHGSPTTVFYLRPKEFNPEASVPNPVRIRVARSWHHQRNLYVSGMIQK